MLPSSLVSAGINHLLAQEPWAINKLVAHAGKIACLDAGTVRIKLKVAADGLVEAAAHDAVPAVTIRAKVSDLPLILQNRERAFSYLKIEGDADFANTISQLSQSLRWDAEEDLSKWIGDIAAVRAVASARSLAVLVQSTHRKVNENLAEYFLEENPMLTRPRDVTAFTRDVVRLRDDVERLEKRIDRLKGTAR
jgi:ubiquinone biosynthesis protein UbiJ